MNNKLSLILFGALVALAVLSATENAEEKSLSEEIVSSRLVRSADARARGKTKKKNKKSKIKKKNKNASKKKNKARGKNKKASKKARKSKRKNKKARGRKGKSSKRMSGNLMKNQNKSKRTKKKTKKIEKIGKLTSADVDTFKKIRNFLSQQKKFENFFNLLQKKANTTIFAEAAEKLGDLTNNGASTSEPANSAYTLLTNCSTSVTNFCSSEGLTLNAPKCLAQFEAFEEYIECQKNNPLDECGAQTIEDDCPSITKAFRKAKNLKSQCVSPDTVGSFSYCMKFIKSELLYAVADLHTCPSTSTAPATSTATTTATSSTASSSSIVTTVSPSEIYDVLIEHITSCSSSCCFF